ncbi:MAG TPA: quinolinate synthase NadA [bacterium]|nr:quinolinate synthase NadA [bacterium]
MSLDLFLDDEELVSRIKELKKQRKAVILAHSYERPEVQDIADYVGDSLELSRLAAKTDADVIVFCSVHFMAETAKILSPQKTVLLPAAEAGCPLADMITPAQLEAEKAKYPNAAVVAYVNCSAEIKAMADVCCTSANALQVVNAMPQEEILFVPDQHLGRWVQSQTHKKMILWAGCCPTHQRMKVSDFMNLKKDHPDAVIVVHPESNEDICALADAVLSTSQMLRYCQASPAKTFIIGTEMGMLHRLRTAMPEKTFLQPSRGLICPNMKMTQLEDVYEALKELKYTIEIPEPIRIKALKSLDGMLAAVPTK